MTKHGRAFQRLGEELRTADARITELEARLKEAEASRDKLWREQHTIIVRAEGYLISIDRLTERAERAEADAVRLREALRRVEWVSGWDVEGHKAIYCPWCNRIKGFGHTFDCVRQAALSPAEKADDEKGVKG